MEDEPMSDRSVVAAVGAPLGTRSTVLCIEDNRSNLELVQRVLARRPEVTLLVAMQGQPGLEMARTQAPDLILLDLHLPDMTGEEVLRGLRETPQTRGTPVVVISADAIPAQIERLLAAGAQAYLTKPLDVKQFLSILDQMLLDRGARP